MRKVAFVSAMILIALFAFGCTPRKQRQTEEPPLPHPSYRIEAELFAAEHVLSVTTTVEYACPATLSEIKLNIYPNAYKEGRAVVTQDKVQAAYPNGKISFGGAEVLSVECDRNITESLLTQDDLVLSVCLAEPVKRGETVRITVKQKVRLANIKHRLGYYDDYYFLSNFYPSVCPFSEGSFITYDYTPYGDPFRFETADFALSLKVPLGYTCACSAKQLRRERQGTFELYEYTAQASREVAAVTSPKIRCNKKETQNATLLYYASDSSDKDKMLALMEDAIGFFEENFGSYPYPTYSVVVAPFFEAGVEHSGLAVISKELSSYQKPKAVLHESAHQWWFGKVGNDEVLSPWLDEGLAEYAVAAYYSARGYEAIAREMIQNAEDCFSVRLAIKGAENTRFDLPLQSLSDGYYDRVYCGGLLLFASLSQTVGTERFHTALRSFADSYDGAVATPDDLIHSLSVSCGKDLSPLFHAHLSATVPFQ